MALEFHKIVSSLPGTLEADSVYYVRVGDGFDLYAVNSAGTIAFKHNGLTSAEVISRISEANLVDIETLANDDQILVRDTDDNSNLKFIEASSLIPNRVKTRERFAGRFYLETDNKWISTNVAQGARNFNWLTSKGTGATPLWIWNELGFGYFKSNSILRNISITGRVNNTEVTGIDISVDFLSGDWVNSFGSTGEATFTNITTASIDNTNFNLNRHHNWEIDLSNFSPASDGILLIAAKPVGTITTTRYYQIHLDIEFEEDV